MLHHACEPTHPEPTCQDTPQTSDPKICISHIRVLNFPGTDDTSHVCQPWTNVAKIHHKTSDPKIFISHIPVLNFAGAALDITPRMCVCVPTHPEPTSQDTLQTSIRKFSSHTSVFWTLPEQLGLDDTSHVCQPWTNVAKIHHKTSYYTTHVCQPILNQRPKTQYKLQSENAHLTHPCFWTLPEQPGTDYTTHVCQPILNHCSKDTPQNLRPQDFHLTHPSFELCRSSSPYHTTHVCQPWTNVPKIHHKTTSDRKIFISHIPVLNFAGTALHVTPRMWANPSWTNVPRHTTNFRSENVHLTHPCFELCRKNSEQMTPRMCANPVPTFQRYTTKPQTLRFSSHTSVLNFAGAALHVTPRMWANPSWTNVPRHTTNFRSENLHLTHPCFELSRNRWHPACVPTLNHCSKDTPQNLRPQDFHLTHPSFELCRSSSPYHTTHVCQPWTNVPNIHHKTSDPKIFISHIPVLSFAGTAPHVTPRMCANPSWTKVPKHTTNFRSDFFHLTHPCFELCRNSLPCYTTHVSQPILYQRPKIQHKLLMTQFCKPILIQPPKIHLSKFQCSPYRRQKGRALQEDTVEWKPVCNLQAKNGSQ